MNSCQVAALFYNQRNAPDFWLTKKQASWLFGVAQDEAGNDPVGKTIAGHFKIAGEEMFFECHRSPNGSALMKVK